MESLPPSQRPPAAGPARLHGPLHPASARWPPSLGARGAGTPRQGLNLDSVYGLLRAACARIGERTDCKPTLFLPPWPAAGWDLAVKLLRPKNDTNRGRLSCAQALRHPFLLLPA